MSLPVSDRQSAAPTRCSSKLHGVPGDVVVGVNVAAETQTRPSVTAATGFTGIGFGADSGDWSMNCPGGQPRASTVTDVTLMVLPRVHTGNVDGGMLMVIV
jgi:hypothetical protein